MAAARKRLTFCEDLSVIDCFDVTDSDVGGQHVNFVVHPEFTAAPCKIRHLGPFPLILVELFHLFDEHVSLDDV